MKSLSFLLLIGIVLITGCEKKQNYKAEYIGKVIDVKLIPTSFNETIKTQVKTDSMFFVIIGIPTIKTGSSITGFYKDGILEIIHDSNGKEFKIYHL